MKVTLQTATSPDADCVAKVFLVSRKAFIQYAQLAHSDADVTTWISESLIPGGNVTIARKGQTIVGMMATSRDQIGSWVDHLYVHPDFVGRDVGSQLITMAKETLPFPIQLFTFQQNTGSRRFYTRHGFYLVKETDGKDNEEGCPDALYKFEG